MKPLSFKRHRFPAAIIRQAVWLYFRFSLSFRDVEELLAARGIEVSYPLQDGFGWTNGVTRALLDRDPIDPNR